MVALAGCLGGDGTDTTEWEVDETLPVETAVQYNSPNCDCCEVYATYLDAHLDADLTVREPEDIVETKRDLGVPAALDSCHTTELGGYVVEGHVPVEAILRLLDDRPKIAGIALPEMPAGSPGMPGEKEESWTVYGFESVDQYEPFLEL